MYENLCDELLSIIPNISWDVEGVEAIKRAVKILSSLQEEEAMTDDEKKRWLWRVPGEAMERKRA